MTATAELIERTKIKAVAYEIPSYLGEQANAVDDGGCDPDEDGPLLDEIRAELGRLPNPPEERA